LTILRTACLWRRRSSPQLTPSPPFGRMAGMDWRRICWGVLLLIGIGVGCMLLPAIIGVRHTVTPRVQGERVDGMENDFPDPELMQPRPMGKCEKCGGAGVYHITEFAEGVPRARAMLLCAECARKHLTSQPDDPDGG